jgi:glutathione S-transferase
MNALGPVRTGKQGADRVKLIIGNKNYSSWSLRGWLAAKQSGLSFEELTVHIDGDDWQATRHEGEFQPSAGKVPVLWDGEVVVWDSLAILEYLADKVGRDRFWPKDDAARGMARAMVAEMHSSYLAMRRACPMNVRKRVTQHELSEEVRSDIVRVLGLWAEARARFGKGGPYLFGTFGAADIFYAPVVSRFVTYGIGVPGFAQAYMQAVWEHDWMQQWIHAAEEEQWVIGQFEVA